MSRQLTGQSERLEPRRLVADGGAGTIAVKRLPRAVALTAGAAVIADLLVYVVASASWGVPSGFAMLSPVSIVVVAFGGVVVAGIGLAALARLTRRASIIFLGVAVIFTLFSLIGPLQALAGAMPGVPAVTPATGATMIVLHLLTGGIIAGLLPAQARN